jgi:hypothetical protein
VDRREDEVAGLGRAQRGVHRLLVAHLTDQDHVGVLAQDAAQRALEGHGVHADLALVDDRLLVEVQELQRVLDGHDVAPARAVDVVDHRGQGRGLARAGGAGEQHDPALLLGQRADDRRQRQLVDGLDRDGDGADDQRDRAALAEGVAAKAREAGDRVGEVDLALVGELLQLGGVVEHLPHRSLGVLRRERRQPLDRVHGPVHAHDRSRGHLEVQVGAALIDEVVQAEVQVEAHCSSNRRLGARA